MVRYVIIVMEAWLCIVISGVAYGDVSFRSQIAPIFHEHCVACHGAKKAEGGYRIDSYANLLKPGDSGESPIDSQAADVGEIVRRLTTDDETLRMPAESRPLTDEQIALIRQWVTAGAPFDGAEPSDLLSTVIPPFNYPAPASNYRTPVPVTAMAFSPDGAELVTSGYHEVLVWRVADGSLTRRIANVGERVNAIAFTPDGALLLVGAGEPGKRGDVRIFDFSSGDLRGVVARATDVVLDLATHPTDAIIAVASADSLIRVVDLAAKSDLRSLAAHADWVTSVAWSDDGTRLASGSRDKSAKVFDTKTGELLVNYQGHAAAVRGVAWSADGSHVLSVGADHKLHRWTATNGEKVAEVAVGGDAFRPTRIHETLYVPCADHHLRWIDLSKNVVTRDLTNHTDWVLCCAVHPASQLVASGAFDGAITLWSMADGTVIRQWRASP